jgi:hypothetical protein
MSHVNVESVCLLLVIKWHFKRGAATEKTVYFKYTADINSAMKKFLTANRPTRNDYHGDKVSLCK